jgi:hypothetical protein
MVKASLFDIGMFANLVHPDGAITLPPDQFMGCLQQPELGFTDPH